MSEMIYPPLKAPFAELINGRWYVTRPWAQWFSQDLFTRIGGTQAPSNDDLEGMLVLEMFGGDAPSQPTQEGDPFGTTVYMPAPENPDPFSSLSVVFPDRYHDVYQDTDALQARVIALEARIAALEASGGFA